MKFLEKVAAVQQELKAPKNLYNGFGKYSYRSAEGILEAVKPLLKKYKLVLTLTDEILTAGDLVYCEAVCLLVDVESKEEVRSLEVRAAAGIPPSRKGMDLSQIFGTSSSYARKYSLNGLFLIDDTKDADTMAPVVEVTDESIDLTPDQIKKAIAFVKAGGLISKIEEKYGKLSPSVLAKLK